MTYLQLVNAVLKKLRETTVASVSESTYSTLIGEFINEAKEEVEDSWDWSHLRTEIDITTVAATERYAVTGLGSRFSVLAVYDITTDSVMQRVSYGYMRRQLLLGTVATGSPGYYNLNGSDSSDDPYVDVYPVPNAVETLTFSAVVPQDDLSDDSDTLTIPTSPIILGAYYRAVKERGEDSGDGSSQAAADYAKVWNAVIARDVALQEEETTWQVV